MSYRKSRNLKLVCVSTDRKLAPRYHCGMFKIGDKVRRKNGGHRMTVEETGADCVFCRWIEGREEKKDWFDVPDLVDASFESSPGPHLRHS